MVTNPGSERKSWTRLHLGDNFSNFSNQLINFNYETNFLNLPKRYEWMDESEIMMDNWDPRRGSITRY